MIARSISSMLGPPEDEWRLWRTGPHAELVGEQLGSLPAGVLRAADAPLLAPEAYADVQLEGAVPALVVADASALAEGTPVAVAVNGVVAATAPVFVADGRRLVAAMIDPALLQAGANDVAIHEIAGTSDFPGTAGHQ